MNDMIRSWPTQEHHQIRSTVFASAFSTCSFNHLFLTFCCIQTTDYRLQTIQTFIHFWSAHDVILSWYSLSLTFTKETFHWCINEWMHAWKHHYISKAAKREYNVGNIFVIIKHITCYSNINYSNALAVSLHVCMYVSMNVSMNVTKNTKFHQPFSLKSLIFESHLFISEF
jgi:hypothetical protein